MHTVVVVGGTGFFGSRICAALATRSEIRLVIVGRDPDKLAAATQSLQLDRAHGVAVDASSPQFTQALRDLQANTVIHTAGPFQGQAYLVASAAIEAGCNYIDLADGRQFVTGIEVLDAIARARGVTVISGASSVPALSSAVIDRYLAEFLELETIEIGIGSGGRVPGLATVQGIFGYCGKPFPCWEKDAWTTHYGWQDLRRHAFPSPVRGRWLARCDVPDLELFPSRYPSARTVSFHAGFASDVGHLFVWLLAGSVRVGLLSGMNGFARPLNRISRWIEPLVSDKGGMFVTMTGSARDGTPRRITWNLLASRNHGPQIPCGAAIALANKLASGKALPRGAMPCVGLLSVEEYLEPLAGLAIQEVVQ